MRENYKIKSLITNALTLLLIIAASSFGQDANSSKAITEKTKTRTELLNELSLRSAQVELDNAKGTYERYTREYENSKNLFKQSIISKKELNDALSDYTNAEQFLKQAEILLEKTKLSFLANATHITIMEAKKYYDSDGRRMLEIVLKNTSNLTQAESALGLTEFPSIAPSTNQSHGQIQALLNIDNIIVSIIDGASCIGKPYEQIIPTLPYGQKAKLTFALLTDVQEAGIEFQYLDQNLIKKIFLEKESLQKTPTVVASLFSQEGQLGTDIRYDLDLEMLVTSDKNFSLTVTNMPPQINSSFVDSRSGARITSMRFTEDVSKHDLNLMVSIPQKLNVNMIDKIVNFQAWMVTAKQLEKINKLKIEYAGKTIPTEKLNEIDASKVDLILIPKGDGRLEILIDNLYAEIKPQQEMNINAYLHNTGTLDLFNIVPEILPPLGWTVEIIPKLIDKLGTNEKKFLEIHLKPSSDVGVGEYEAHVEARGQSGNSVVEAIEKRLKVRINAEAHITTTLILVLALVGLIGTVVIFGIKLSKR